ncbi:MAG TPA: J domain-containing protein [Candidatus Nanoarchaeia archaeon]|nr:J domain-containing protein [Candidatus Nanoarchaeia archaeon]
MGKRLIDILGISQGDLEKRLIATDGKQGKSPFEDPSIVRPSKINNLYERLGLENFCEDQESIKSAYRRQAVVWHPDKNPRYFDDANFEFSKITEAYETLSDSGKKSDYDDQLREKLRQNGKNEDFQQNPTNALKSSRLSRSYVRFPDIDGNLKPEQKAILDYLDFLVDIGQITLSGSTGMNMQLQPYRCEYCKETISPRGLVISYRHKTMAFGESYAHAFLAHGSRAFLTEFLKSLPGQYGYAMAAVDTLCKELGIDVSQRTLNNPHNKLLK